MAVPARRSAAASAHLAPGVRTFLIADVRGYTRFTQEHGDAAAARLAERFAAVAREAVAARGGEVVELRGDEALAVFTSARQAIRAAAELHLALAEEAAADPSLPLRAGIGLDAGEALPVEGGFRGAALNLAARLCAIAGPGETLASDGVVHLAGTVDGVRYDDAGTQALKGIDAPVHVIRIVSPETPPGAVPARRPGEASPELPAGLDAAITPLVGREQDLWWLLGSWRLARRGQGRLLIVSGPTGIGRTRLASEVARAVHDGGSAVRYLPLEVDPDALEGLAAELESAEPTLVVIDDLELARPAALGRLIGAATDGITAPVLILGTCRDDVPAPALSDVLARLDAADAHRSLDPVDADAVAAIAAVYSTRPRTDVPVAAILEASGGIPAEIHALAAEWARTEASRRLGSVATRASTGRRELRAIEAELADNVIDLQQIRERSRSITADTGAESAVCPFKGLAAFEAADADLFFGRERLVAELVARLVGATFMGIVGPSGSGKSSALRAGLLPALAAGVLPGSETWRQVILRPGASPMDALGRALGAGQGDDLVEATLASVPPGQRIVIAIDQFEELYTACADEAARAAFVHSLVHLATDPERRAKIVVALRADFYGRCSAYPVLAELLATGHVLVGPMRPDEFRRAIELPAQRAGLRIEPELVDALVADVADEPGALPLLSTALLELWTRRDGRTLRYAAYEQTGGVRGAVARMAEEAYGGLPAHEQGIARAVLLRLAMEDETRTVIRRRAPLSEFDASDTAVAEVIAALTTRRLLTVDEGSLEVAHDALLREWPRLADWLDEDAQGRGLRRHLTTAAQEWEAGGRDPGELYRGARLASALEWTAAHDIELNALEREFLAESRAASERETERARRTNRRLRLLLAASVAGLAIALVAGGFAVIQQREAEQAAARAEEQRAVAESQRATAEEQRAVAEAARQTAEAQRIGALALTEPALDRSLLLAREALALDPSIETRSTLLAALQRAPAAIAVLQTDAHDGLEWVEVTPDGSRVIAQSNSGGALIWDTDTLELLPSGFGTYADRFGHDISPDGRYLATLDPGTENRNLFTTDITGDFFTSGTGKAVAGPVGPIAYTGDGAALVTLEDPPDEPGRRVLVLRDPISLDPTGRAVAVRIASGGSDLAAIGGSEMAYTLRPNDGSAGFTQIVDLRAGRVEFEIPLSGPLAVSPDQRTLAIGLDDGSIATVDLATRDRSIGARGHSGTITAVAYAPDGRTLVSVGLDREVVLWDPDSLTVREILSGHSGPILGLAIGPEGTTAYTGSADGTVIVWDLVGDRRMARSFSLGSPASPFAVHLATVAGDDRTLVYALPGGRVRLHDLSGAIPDRDVVVWDEASVAAVHTDGTQNQDEPSTGEITSVAAEPGGTLVAITSDLPVPVLLDTATGRIRRLEGGHEGWFTSAAAFSADGRLLATGGADEHIVIWDVETGQVIKKMHPTFGFANAIAFDPTGTLLAVGATGGQGYGRVAIWDIEHDRSATGRTLVGDVWNTWSARFTDDGRELVTAGEQSGSVKIWDVATGTQILPIDAHAGSAIDAIPDPSGRFVVSAGDDGVARLWDLESGQAIGRPLTAQQGATRAANVAIALIDGGRSVVVVDQFGNGTIWPLDEAVWAEHACRVAGRTLTDPELHAFLGGRAAQGCTD